MAGCLGPFPGFPGGGIDFCARGHRQRRAGGFPGRGGGRAGRMGIIQYWSWGRSASKQVASPRMPAQNPEDAFVLELNDQERDELLHLLEENVQEGTRRSEERRNGERAALRRNLLDKVRMFAA